MTTGLYTYRPDYSYLRYLEEQSHFDDLKLFIAKENRASVMSSSALQNEMSLLVNSLQNGNEQIVARLDVAIANLENLGAIFERGFANIDARLDGIQHSLNELTRLTANRDQTWANEQYRIAGDAYSRGLHREALDYASRAIEGYHNKPGFRLEASYHLLRGTVRLGDKRNFDPKVVDLEGAVSDFANALRYSDSETKSSLANQKLAWTSYCLGRFEDSVLYAKAVAQQYGRVFEEARFIEAKASSRMGNKDKAVQLICRLGDLNCLYFMRAFADPDFLDIHSRVKSEVDCRRERLRAGLIDRSAKTQKIIGFDKATSEKYAISDVPAVLLQRIDADIPLKNLIELDSETRNVLQNIKSKIQNNIQSLSNSIEGAEKIYKIDLSQSKAIGAGNWGFIAGVVAFVVYFYNGTQSGEEYASGNAFTIFTSPFVGIISGFVASAVIRFFARMTHRMEALSRREANKAGPTADIPKLEKLKNFASSIS